MIKVYETVKKAMKMVFSEFEDGCIVTYKFILESTKALLPKEYEDCDWESDLDAILDEMVDDHHINEVQVWVDHKRTTLSYKLELDCMFFFNNV